MRSGASLWLVLTAGLAAPAVHAETVYVVEQLVVSVASSQEADAERVGQVKSGDRLELLEREGEEAHVRLPSGKEGWLKASYLTTEEPLAQRLTERTAEVEKLKEEGEKLRQDGEKLRQDVTRLQSQLAGAAAAAPTPAGQRAGGRNSTAAPAEGDNSTPAGQRAGGGNSTAAPAEGNTSAAAGPSTEAATSSPPEPAHETVFLREPDRHGQTSWALVIGVAAAMLLVGFGLGWTTLDRRIRQKYGGLRIY